MYHTFHIVATAVAFSAPPYIIAVLCQFFCFMQFRTVWIWIILIMIMVRRVVEFSSGATKLERFLPKNQQSTYSKKNIKFLEEVSKSAKI